MYVRTFIEPDGRIFLEQLLQFSGEKNGKWAANQAKWERVPMVGRGGVESYSLAIGKIGGFFIVEAKDTYYDGPSEGMKERVKTHFVSAFDVYHFDEREKGLFIITKDNFSFTAKISKLDFMELVVRMVSSFKIMKVDLAGKMEEYSVQ